jgi:hypothetical protein
LIDVTPIVHSSTGQASSSQGVRVVDSFPRDARFASLSHCWGKTPNPTKLDKTSYKRYHDFISFAALPKSFQDAIHITRFLGLKYLWIDSFCIQQDSAVDFDIEASKMADVYRDSFIVIVAAASDNSHGGCLIKSDPDKFLRIQIDGGRDLYFGMRQCKFTKFLDGVAEVYSEFPTHERAWCYQEQILSQRLLYCNRTELAFECRDRRRCECGSTRLEPHVTTPAARKLLSIRNPELSMILNLAQQKSYSIANINARWEAVVIYYSRLKLLRPEQRLSALSGLAKSFQMILGQHGLENTYLSGLWRKTIRSNLLWRVSDPYRKGNARARPSTYRAPSWSWASVDNPDGVEYDRQLSHKLSWLDMSDWEGFLVDANSVPALTDTTGAVNSGSLHFRTHLRKAHIRAACSCCKRASSNHKNRRVEIETDHWQHMCTFPEESMQTLGSDITFLEDCILNHDAGLNWKETTSFARFDRRCKLAEISLLHVATNVTKMRNIDHFLALKALPYQSGVNAPQRYERIGLVIMSHGNSGTRDKWFDSVWKAGLTSEAKIHIELV